MVAIVAHLVMIMTLTLTQDDHSAVRHDYLGDTLSRNFHGDYIGYDNHGSNISLVWQHDSTPFENSTIGSL